MTRAEKLSREIRAWGQRSRGSRRFSQKLAEATDRIAVEFHGDARDKLLDEAEAAFERQRESYANVRKAVAAVRELRRSQERVVDLLLSVTSHRPPDATLH
jgi:hypothetical protein